MKVYVKNIDEQTKLCKEVGIGTNQQYYQTHGFQYLDVQQNYDGRYYLSGYLPKRVYTKQELYDITYNKKCQVAYTGIYLIKDESSYLFQTNDRSVTLCTATKTNLLDKADDYIVYWKSWRDNTPCILQLTKVQFIKVFELGLNMVNEAFGVQGTLNAEIEAMTEKQLGTETYINKFKKKIDTEFAKIQKEFELNNI